jgi:type II secretory pathway component PulJ
MGVATTIMSLSTVSAIRARRSIQKSHQLRQTQYLLDAGVLRCARQLQASPEYRGETWHPDLESLERFNPEVVIAAEETEQLGVLQVTVVAQMGNPGTDAGPLNHLKTKRTHQFKYRLEAPKSTN